MLAFILRGCFLVVIISWYSQGVWQTIDGYFRDRFQKYLQEEIAKNPRLRADMKTFSTRVDKVKGSHAVKVESITMEKAVIDTTELFPSEGLPEDVTLNLSTRAETNVPTVDKDGQQLQKIDHQNKTNAIITEEPTKIESIVAAVDASPKRKNRHKKRHSESKLKEEPQIGKSTKKKNKLNLLTLTEADFRLARRSKHYDFSKFEVEDEDENCSDQEMDGILVSKLPFKPLVDLAGLQRITEDEFCPLSIDDEESCGDTISWS